AEGEGAMAAILGLDDAQIERVCTDLAQDHSVEGTVVPANYNAPGQVVIAGHSNAVEAAIDACKAAGARRAVQLPVSVPSHTPLMQPAKAALSEALDAIELHPPRIPVLHNIDVQARTEPDSIRHALVEQLVHPVRWTDTVLALLARSITQFYECGPGRVLCGLGKRMDRSVGWQTLDDVEWLRLRANGQPETQGD
ncbi:MAG: ACP S-malonyltransferase, partial [Pseudomonadota bacterium]